MPPGLVSAGQSLALESRDAEDRGDRFASKPAAPAIDDNRLAVRAVCQNVIDDLGNLGSNETQGMPSGNHVAAFFVEESDFCAFVITQKRQIDGTENSLGSVLTWRSNIHEKRISQLQNLLGANLTPGHDTNEKIES